MDSGQVVNVTTRKLGDELAAAVTLGATTITITDVVDFNEDGGTLWIGGTAYDYLTADDDTGIITLVTALLAGYAAEEPVTLDGSETLAQVVLDGDGEAITARIPHHLRTLLVDGIRSPNKGEWVRLDRTDSQWRIADVFDVAPQITVTRPVRVDAGGSTVGQFDETGGLAATTGDFAGDGTGRGLSVYGTDFQDWINSRSAGITAYGSLPAGSLPAGANAITAEAGLFEVSVTADAARGYVLSWYGRAQTGTGGVANTQATIRIRDGGASAPTLTSPIARTYSFNLSNTARPTSFSDNYKWSATTGLHRLLVTAQGSSIIDTTYEWGLSVVDEGVTPLNTAVAFGGAAVQEFVSTWEASSCYHELPTVYRTDPLALQATNVKSYLGFTGNATVGETTKTIQTALTGATVTKLEFYLKNMEWNGKSKGTAVLGTHSDTDLTTAPTVGMQNPDIKRVTNWAMGTEKWVTMPSSLHAGFVAGTHRGIQIGNSQELPDVGFFHGTATATGRAKIRITYTR